MPQWIKQPTTVEAAGNKPKRIEEFFGCLASNDPTISIARMTSPAGWIEPGQTPEFREFTLVLKGLLRVESRGGCIDVKAGQGVVTEAGEWVRYSTPLADGAEYLAVCLPGFSPDTVHRDADHSQLPQD